MWRNRYVTLAWRLALSSALPLAMVLSAFGLLFKFIEPFQPYVTTEELRLPERMPLVVPWVCRDIGRLNKLRQNWPFIGTKPYKDLMYVDGDVLITGHSVHIERVLKLLDPQQKARLALFTRRSPTDIEMALERQASLDSISWGNQRTTVRYQVIKPDSPGAAAFSAAGRGPTDKRTVAQLTCAVNLLRNLYQPEVSAEPNYHLSPAGWRGGGSPWTQNGGGWVKGLDGGGLDWANPDMFKAQWAFAEQGIDLFDNSEDPQRKLLPHVTGEGVRIGIFDTSPFDDQDWDVDPLTGGRVCNDCTLQELVNGTVPDEFADMRLTVRHDPMESTPDCPGWDRHEGKEVTLETQNLSSHGLFVAGLAYTVAPSSTLHLVRVLEDDACGSLYTISDGIKRFMAQAVTDNVEHVVINLSLGAHQPPNPKSFGLPTEVTTLQDTITEALNTQGINVIVVAAAGNDSYPPGSPVEMEIPAKDPGVIGVAASNKGRTRGCFSNADVTSDTINVAAPGGDGEFENNKNPCVVPNCSDSNPDPCVISLVHPPESGKAAYAYWVGTSFAAPLVSGQEALLFEEEMGPLVASEKTCSAANDNTLPNGIIDLGAPLGTPCPTPTPSP